MADSSSSHGSMSNASRIHTDSPSLQHFSPAFDQITTRIPSFSKEFNIPEFMNLMERVGGTKGTLTHVADMVEMDSPISVPPSLSKFVGLVDSNELLREKRIKDGKEAKSMAGLEDSPLQPSMEARGAARVQPDLVEITGNLPNKERIMSDLGLTYHSPMTAGGSPRILAKPRADLGETFPKLMMAGDPHGNIHLSMAELACDEARTAAIHKNAMVNDDPHGGSGWNPRSMEAASQSPPKKVLDPPSIMIGNISIPTNGNSEVQHNTYHSKRTTLKYVKPEVINGEVFVKPTWAVAKKGMNEWESTAVGYFIGRKPSFMGVKNYAYSVWSGLKDVKATTNGFFFFKFDNEQHLLSVLEGGPWMYGGQPLFLERWKLGMSLERQQHKEVPIWVKFRNLPIEYWTDEGLSTVASSIGHPLYPDAFTSSRVRLDYARVCVVVDIESKFKDHVYLLLPSESGDYNGTRKVMVEYEWKPVMCSVCHAFGHKEGGCPTRILAASKPKSVHIYVPKANVSEVWREPKPKTKSNKMKGKLEEMATMVHELISSPRSSSHATYENSREPVRVDANPFAALGTLDDSDGESLGHLEELSMQGPPAALPEVIR